MTFLKTRKTMKLQEIKNIAKGKGVNPARLFRDCIISGMWTDELPLERGLLEK